MKEIELTEPQSQMFRMQCPNPLFIGGYGSGKTESLIANTLRDALWNPGGKIGSYCPTYDLLKLNLEPRLEETLIEACIGYKMNKSDHVCEIENGSKIIMRSMDNPARIVAYEVFRSHVDEIDTLSKAKAEQVWQKIIARNRQKVYDRDGNRVINQVSAYTTPDHGFASFTYKRWGKNDSERYKYVRASTYSNPHVDQEYVDGLIEVFDAEMIEAYVLGEWCNFNQGTVYRAYDRKENGTDKTHKSGEPVRIGMDFNVGKMAAVIYVVRGSKWYAVDEIVNKLDTPDMIDEIQTRYNGCTVTIYPDSTGKNRSSKDATISDISLLKEAGFGIKAKSTNPRVRDRVLASNKAFREKKVLVNEHKCPTFAECLEQQGYDSNGEPDKSSGYDHSNDAGTYPIAYTFPVRKPMHSKSVRGLH